MAENLVKKVLFPQFPPIRTDDSDTMRLYEHIRAIGLWSKAFENVVDQSLGALDTGGISDIKEIIELISGTPQDGWIITYDNTGPTLEWTDPNTHFIGLVEGTPGDGQVPKYSSMDGRVHWRDDEVGMAGQGEANVQVDFNVTDTTSDAYIKNNPYVYFDNNGVPGTPPPRAGAFAIDNAGRVTPGITDHVTHTTDATWTTVDMALGQPEVYWRGVDPATPSTNDGFFYWDSAHHRFVQRRNTQFTPVSWGNAWIYIQGIFSETDYRQSIYLGRFSNAAQALAAMNSNATAVARYSGGTAPDADSRAYWIDEVRDTLVQVTNYTASATTQTDVFTWGDPLPTRAEVISLLPEIPTISTTAPGLDITFANNIYNFAINNSYIVARITAEVAQWAHRFDNTLIPANKLDVYDWAKSGDQSVIPPGKLGMGIANPLKYVSGIGAWTTSAVIHYDESSGDLPTAAAIHYDDANDLSLVSGWDGDVFKKIERTVVTPKQGTFADLPAGSLVETPGAFLIWLGVFNSDGDAAAGLDPQAAHHQFYYNPTTNRFRQNISPTQWSEFAIGNFGDRYLHDDTHFFHPQVFADDASALAIANANDDYALIGPTDAPQLKILSGFVDTVYSYAWVDVSAAAGASSFLGLTDTPATFGTAGQVPVVNAAGDGLEWGNAGTGTASTFLDLSDTPDSYGHSGQYLHLNAAADALVWTAIPDTADWALELNTDLVPVDKLASNTPAPGTFLAYDRMWRVPAGGGMDLTRVVFPDDDGNLRAGTADDWDQDDNFSKVVAWDGEKWCRIERVDTPASATFTEVMTGDSLGGNLVWRGVTFQVQNPVLGDLFWHGTQGGYRYYNGTEFIQLAHDSAALAPAMLVDDIHHTSPTTRLAAVSADGQRVLYNFRLYTVSDHQPIVGNYPWVRTERPFPWVGRFLTALNNRDQRQGSHAKVNLLVNDPPPNYLYFRNWTQAQTPLMAVNHLPVGGFVGLRQGENQMVLRILSAFDSTNQRYEVEVYHDNPNFNYGGFVGQTELLITAPNPFIDIRYFESDKSLRATFLDTTTSTVTLPNIPAVYVWDDEEIRGIAAPHFALEESEERLWLYYGTTNITSTIDSYDAPSEYGSDYITIPYSPRGGNRNQMWRGDGSLVTYPTWLFSGTIPESKIPRVVENINSMAFDATARTFTLRWTDTNTSGTMDSLTSGALPAYITAADLNDDILTGIDNFAYVSTSKEIVLTLDRLGGGQDTSKFTAPWALLTEVQTWARTGDTNIIPDGKLPPILAPSSVFNWVRTESAHSSERPPPDKLGSGGATAQKVLHGDGTWGPITAASLPAPVIYKVIDNTSVAYTTESGRRRLNITVTGANNSHGTMVMFQFSEDPSALTDMEIEVGINDSDYVRIKWDNPRGSGLENLRLANIDQFAFLLLYRAPTFWHLVGGTVTEHASSWAQSGNTDDIPLGKIPNIPYTQITGTPALNFLPLTGGTVTGRTTFSDSNVTALEASASGNTPAAPVFRARVGLGRRIAMEARNASGAAWFQMDQMTGGNAQPGIGFGASGVGSESAPDTTLYRSNANEWTTPDRFIASEFRISGTPATTQQNFGIEPFARAGTGDQIPTSRLAQISDWAYTSNTDLIPASKVTPDFWKVADSDVDYTTGTEGADTFTRLTIGTANALDDEGTTIQFRWIDNTLTPIDRGIQIRVGTSGTYRLAIYINSSGNLTPMRLENVLLGAYHTFYKGQNDNWYLMGQSTWGTGGGSGVSSFLALTDTPTSYGTAGQAPVMNAAADALEWSSPGFSLVEQASGDVVVTTGSTWPTQANMGLDYTLPPDSEDALLAIDTGRITSSSGAWTNSLIWIKATDITKFASESYGGAISSTHNRVEDWLPGGVDVFLGHAMSGGVRKLLMTSDTAGRNFYDAKVYKVVSAGTQSFNFLGLSDTPTGYGEEGQYPIVNPGQDGLQWEHPGVEFVTNVTYTHNSVGYFIALDGHGDSAPRSDRIICFNFTGTVPNTVPSTAEVSIDYNGQLSGNRRRVRILQANGTFRNMLVTELGPSTNTFYMLRATSNSWDLVARTWTPSAAADFAGQVFAWALIGNTTTIPTAKIPNLDAGKITTGTFGTARIPELAASKITSGQFVPARLGSGTPNQGLVLTISGGVARWQANSATGVTTFVALTDTPDDFTGQDGKILAVNSAEDALEFIDLPSGGAGDFTDLGDTPASLGTAGQFVRVNAAGDALEFTNPPAVTDTNDYVDSVDLGISGQTLSITVGRTGSLADLTDSVTLPTGSGTGDDAYDWATEGNNDRIPTSKLGSGTGSSSNFLRGDGAWHTPTLLGLSGTPASWGTEHQVLAVNSAGDGLEWEGPGYPTSISASVDQTAGTFTINLPRQGRTDLSWTFGYPADWDSTGGTGLTLEQARDGIADFITPVFPLQKEHDDAANKLYLTIDQQFENVPVLMVFNHVGDAILIDRADASRSRTYRDAVFTISSLVDLAYHPDNKRLYALGGAGDIYRSDPGELTGFARITGDIPFTAGEQGNGLIYDEENDNWWASSTEGIWDVDISNPANSTYVGNWETSGSSRSIAGLAYLNGHVLAIQQAHPRSFLRVNTTTPSSSTVIGTVQNVGGGFYQATSASGGTVYAVWQSGGVRQLHVIPFANPGNPTVLGNISGLGSATTGGMVAIDVPVDTDLIPEGSNLYYTDARWDDRLEDVVNPGGSLDDSLDTIDVDGDTYTVRNLFAINSEGDLPAPGEHQIGQGYYILQDMTLRIGVNRPHTQTSPTGTFNAITTRNDLHVVTSLPTDQNSLTDGHYYYLNHGSQSGFYQVAVRYGVKELIQTSARSALADSRSSNTQDVEWLGAEATSTDALRFTYSVDSGTDYFFLDTSDDTIKILDQSTFDGTTGTTNHYSFEQLPTGGGGTGGATTFLDLTDTPDSYGNSGQYVKLNAAADALEFAAIPTFFDWARTGNTELVPTTKLGTGGAADKILTWGSSGATWEDPATSTGITQADADARYARLANANTFTAAQTIDFDGLGLKIDASGYAGAHPALEVIVGISAGHRKAIQATRVAATAAWFSVDFDEGGNNKPGFGLGTGMARDTILYRDAADVWRTPDNFHVGELRVDASGQANSRTNLGLGTVATEDTVPVDKGGTGSTTEAEARTNLEIMGRHTNDTLAGTGETDDLLRVNVNELIEELQENVFYYSDSPYTVYNIGATAGHIFTTSPYQKTVYRVWFRIDEPVDNREYRAHIYSIEDNRNIIAVLGTSNSVTVFGTRSHAFDFPDGGVDIPASQRVAIVVSRYNASNDSSAFLEGGGESANSPRTSYNDADEDFVNIGWVEYENTNPAAGSGSRDHGNGIRGNPSIYYRITYDHGHFVSDSTVAHLANANTFTDTQTIDHDGTGLIVDAREYTGSAPAFEVRVGPSGDRKAFQLKDGENNTAWASFEFSAGGAGKQGFALGSGTAGRDVVLYRDAADVWRTPDNFHVRELRVDSAGRANSRTQLGLGTAATEDTGTGSGDIPVLDANGRLPVARLGSGTASSTTVLLGDGSWGHAPIDIHESVGSASTISDADRIIFSDESQSGDPTRYTSASALADYMQGEVELNADRITAGEFNADRVPEVKDQRSGSLQFWTGTQAQYDAIDDADIEDNRLYFITG